MRDWLNGFDQRIHPSGGGHTIMLATMGRLNYHTRRRTMSRVLAPRTFRMPISLAPAAR
jgi:hypothetical protein